MATGAPVENTEEADKDIFEIKKATEQMKPILIYFQKPKDLLAFGKKAVKDPEVDACSAFDEDLWKRWVITELSKEYACVRVNTRKADAQLLRKYRVARAPVIMIVDFELKPHYFTASARLNHSSLASVMERVRKNVESQVKKLSKSEEDSPLVQRAKARAEVIEQRELYDDGLGFLEKQKWNQAEEKFNKALAITQDSEWKKKSQVGLIEIKAGQAFHEGEKLYKLRRFKPCKDLLAATLKDCKEATYFCGLIKELLEKVNKKLN